MSRVGLNPLAPTAMNVDPEGPARIVEGHAAASGRASPEAGVLALQRAAGNRAVASALLAGGPEGVLASGAGPVRTLSRGAATSSSGAFRSRLGPRASGGRILARVARNDPAALRPPVRVERLFDMWLSPGKSHTLGEAAFDAEWLSSQAGITAQKREIRRRLDDRVRRRELDQLEWFIRYARRAKTDSEARRTWLLRAIYWRRHQAREQEREAEAEVGTTAATVVGGVVSSVESVVLEPVESAVEAALIDLLPERADDVADFVGQAARVALHPISPTGQAAFAIGLVTGFKREVDDEDLQWNLLRATLMNLIPLYGPGSLLAGTLWGVLKELYGLGEMAWELGELDLALRLESVGLGNGWSEQQLAEARKVVEAGRSIVAGLMGPQGTRVAWELGRGIGESEGREIARILNGPAATLPWNLGVYLGPTILDVLLLFVPGLGEANIARAAASRGAGMLARLLRRLRPIMEKLRDLRRTVDAAAPDDGAPRAMGERTAIVPDPPRAPAQATGARRTGPPERRAPTRRSPDPERPTDVDDTRPTRPEDTRPTRPERRDDRPTSPETPSGRGLHRLTHGAAEPNPAKQALDVALRMELPDTPALRRFKLELPRVWAKIRDPDFVFQVMREVRQEATRLGTSDRAALRRLVAGRDAPHPVYPGRDTFQLPDAEFRAVAQRPEPFVDYMFANNEHGAYTHMFQELVVDRALGRRGGGSQFRQAIARLEGSVEVPIKGMPTRIELWDLAWQATFDDLGGRGHINHPETLGPVLRRYLTTLEPVDMRRRLPDAAELADLERSARREQGID